MNKERQSLSTLRMLSHGLHLVVHMACGCIALTLANVPSVA